MKNVIYYILAIAFMLVLMCSGCGSPYWRVYRHDGVEKRGYLKAGWPYDAKCATYFNGNRPVQPKTWRSQHYWRKSKR